MKTFPRHIALTSCLAVLLAIGQPSFSDDLNVQFDPYNPAHAVVGITKPKQLVTLGAVPPGRIATLTVSEGQHVLANDLLVGLEDAAQTMRTNMAMRRAQSNENVQLARVRMQQADSEWQRLSNLDDDGFAASKELSDAKLAVEEATLLFEIAKHELELDKLDYQREQALLAQFHIRAPFNGYVTEILKYVGETVKEREGVITIAQLHPLLVEFNCPIPLYPSIRQGQQINIVPIDDGWQPRPGTVVFASEVADAASQTFKVQLQVDNRDGQWVAGLKVQADFSQPEPSSRGL